MHASVASSFSSSSSSLSLEQQHLEMLVRQPPPPVTRTHGHTRTASNASAAATQLLPSLASLRMHTPPPLAEFAPSSLSQQQQQASFGVTTSGRSSSMSSASSVGGSSTSTAAALNTSCASNNSNGANGFWKNPILYKTTICDNWAAKKPCKYGARCWYAHGFGELRYVPRLDQLPENVREALFVEPALARALFQEMTTSSLDAGYASSSCGTSSSSSARSECESRASLTSSSASSIAGSCRLSMSPSSSVSDAISPPTATIEQQQQQQQLDTTALLFTTSAPPPPAATASYLSDRRSKRWAPGAAWSAEGSGSGCETPRASRFASSPASAATVTPAARSRATITTTSDYRLFDAAHPLAIDLSFLRD